MRHRTALLSCLLAAACSTGATSTRPTALPTSASPTPSTPPPSPTVSPIPATVTAAPTPTQRRGPTRAPQAARVASCPTYRAPDPRRPVLTAEVSVSGRNVTGSERVVFTPDLAVNELVLRLWASSPRPARAGGSSTVAAVAVNGAARPFSRPSPTLVRIPYASARGVPITIELSFSLVLPVGADDRYGSRGSTSWFAGGLPLLAWERGRGWATEPPTSSFAEASTSEQMRLEQLTVHHAAGLSVIATGTVIAQSATITVTSAPAVRDVAVAVGAFRTVTLAGPVPILVGVAPQLGDNPTAVARELVRAMRVHVARFGPFPYGRLAVAVLPDIRGGIEYPGAVLLGTGQHRDATASHEVAHEWFYGLVGNDQGRDPWLDEAFATYAEALDRGTSAKYLSTTIPADGRGRTGAPMTYWEGRSSYVRSVYVQGAAALLRARTANPAAFDAQVRCYVARNAHRIATTHDVAFSMTLAVKRLTTAGALPPAS